MPTVVANRYARALADVVAAKGDFRKTLSELEDFRAVYHESAELREFCDTPAVAMPQKLTVLQSIAGKMATSPITLNFLRVLMSHYRFRLLDEISEAFRKLADARLGIVRVNISSASSLSNEERELLRARFNQLTHLQSELEFHLDQALIGGLVAQIGSTVYDGSIRGGLDRIKEQLIQ